MDTNKTKKKWKELGIDALFDFAGAFLQAVGVWCFIEPSRIAPGGVSGIALMLNHLFALPIGADQHDRRGGRERCVADDVLGTHAAFPRDTQHDPHRYRRRN